ncbi:CHAP domain-containing protein [Kitasatospora sp. NPDC093806]|uniref:CHAP domain-containing protein n=1 Tax=Kitasatospora sp. NPDC093806 TaxID=3155075 RepID=UPI003415D726
MPSTAKPSRISRSVALTAATAGLALSGLVATPASADTGSSVAAAATAEIGNGPCAHGGYTSGDRTSNSCGRGGHAAHAWCADFAGWAWARAGAANLSYLSGAARDFYDYGKTFGTLHNTPRVGDAVVFNYRPGADWADHVALVTAVGNGTVTMVGGNEGHRTYADGIVQTESTSNYAVGSAPWGQTISGYISPVAVNTPVPAPAPAPSGTTTPATPTSNNSHIQIIGADNAMYNIDADYKAGKWSSWTKMDNSTLTSITSATTGNTTHVYAVADGRVYTRDGDRIAGTWGDWIEVPGGAVGVKAISATAGGNSAHIQIIGADGAMYTIDADYGAGKWSTWTKMDSSNLTALASTTTGNTDHVYAVAADGHVYSRDADRAAGTWSDWIEVPGGAVGVKGITASVTDNNSHIQIIGADGAMYNIDADYKAGSWSSWTKMDSTNLIALTSATTGNTTHVYAVAADGRVYTRDADRTAGTWGSWIEVPGGAVGVKGITASVTA